MEKQGYVPNYGDLDGFRYQRLLRTKSRAYQLACWQGWLGTHEFFLGRPWHGWAHLLLPYLALLASILIHWTVGLALLALAIWATLAAIKKIATSSPHDPIYSGECGPIFQSIHMLSSGSILWNMNFWKGKEPTDPWPEDVKPSA